MLMDSATLTGNCTLCVTEASPVKEIPSCLTEAEQATFNLLQSSDGISLRLEQERIPFGRVATFLHTLKAQTPPSLPNPPMPPLSGWSESGEEPVFPPDKGGLRGVGFFVTWYKFVHDEISRKSCRHLSTITSAS